MEYIIYGIRNCTTGYIYIGCTSWKLSLRGAAHMALLRRGEHHSRKFQEAYDSGEDKFEILSFYKTSNKNEAAIIESIMINYYSDISYNSNQVKSCLVNTPISILTELHNRVLPAKPQQERPPFIERFKGVCVNSKGEYSFEQYY